MVVDIIDGDDWKAIFVDGDLFHQGHSISDFTWGKLLQRAGVVVNEYDSEFPHGWAESSFDLHKQVDYTLLEK